MADLNPRSRHGRHPEAISEERVMNEFDFTGDLTHTTDDPKARRERIAEFKEIASKLKVKTVRFLPENMTLRSIGAKPTRNFPVIFSTASITVEAEVKKAKYEITELPVTKG